MKQSPFHERYQKDWDELKSILNLPSKNKKKKTKKETPSKTNFPKLYRQVCHHLSLAKERNYSYSLIKELESLAIKGHHHLYHDTIKKGNVLTYFAYEFPQRVRNDWQFVLISAACFILPLIFVVGLIEVHPHVLYRFIDSSTLNQIEYMYRPGADHIGRQRDVESDVAMWAFYIQNNVGIDFHCFAGGLLCGLGTIFYLVYNGIYFGGIVAYIHQLGYQETFYNFVSGHSALELIAMVICGAAGLKLGRAILAPGQLSRPQALRVQAKEAVLILYGGAVMTFLAAFIEAYWSSRADISSSVKFAFGITQWALVFGYFLFMGKGRATR